VSGWIGTGLSAQVIVNGPRYSRWSLERAKLLLANLGTERPLKLNASALHDIAVYLEEARKYGRREVS
jgi:hypothetical protein